ncbi:hypothetical protein ALC57_02218 [Trachymyrmex cornetzi]|uniref:Envelope fusion protein n=1 Tax=Trachymyrmex cornetzi TaxID=471704 RepID=A0A151JPM7_9HYME|nr:hypothetical protein ALC57_02218 [Trachymyrmex cornetzi]
MNQNRLYRHLQKTIDNITHDHQVNEIQNYIIIILEHLDKAILEHELDLNILIDGILFGKQGLIHPRIVPPSLIIQSSRLLHEQNPDAEFPITMHPTEIDKLLKISDLRIAYSQKRLIYVLHIPLITKTKYNLYKLTPLPIRQNYNLNKFAAIQPNTDYIALDEDADSYYELQNEDAKECIVTDKTYICPAVFPLRKTRQTPNCHVNILLKREIDPKQCKITVQPIKDTYWKALLTSGNWIYSAPQKERIRIECLNFERQEEIDEIGIITIQRGCKIRAPSATMSHSSTIAREISHYVSTINLDIQNLYKNIENAPPINLTSITNELWNFDKTYNTETTFDEIIRKAQEIKERRMQTWKIDIYNSIACSIELLGTITLLIAMVYHRPWTSIMMTQTYEKCCRKNKRNSQPLSNPSRGYKNDSTPAPISIVYNEVLDAANTSGSKTESISPHASENNAPKASVSDSL